MSKKSVLLLFPMTVNQIRNFIFPVTVAVKWPLRPVMSLKLHENSLGTVILCRREFPTEVVWYNVIFSYRRMDIGNTLLTLNPLTWKIW